jgi:hypothetical protein
VADNDDDLALRLGQRPRPSVKGLGRLIGRRLVAKKTTSPILIEQNDCEKAELVVINVTKRPYGARS